MFGWLFGKKAAEPSKSPSTKMVKLTSAQQDCLTCASMTEPIYGENPSFSSAQTPNGSRPHNQRTIDSMVKRGLLSSDGKGGYLLTNSGLQLRRSDNW